MKARKINPFGLRLDPIVKAKAAEQAQKNRRSLNTELGLLIEEGLERRRKSNECSK